MSSRLELLPVELITEIGECLPEKCDILNLSGASRCLHNILVLTIFSTIRFTNIPADAPIVNEIVSTDILETCVLPDFAVKLLTGESLSNVLSLVVKFLPENDFRRGWAGQPMMSFWDDEVLPDEGYNWQDMQDEWGNESEMEEKNQWRKVMSEVWSQLAKNMTVCELKIANLPPKIPSSWKGGSSFGNFLSRLKTVEMGFWATKYDFYGGFDGVATHTHPLPYSMLYGSLKQLEELRLFNCVIEEGLVHLACGRSYSNRLRKLHLSNCIILEYADESVSLTADEVVPTSWEDFLTDIRVSGPVLEEFIVDYPEPIPLTIDEYKWSLMNDDMYIPPPEEEEDTSRFRQSLNHNGRARLFDYRIMMPEPGFALPNEAVLRVEFENAAFDPFDDATALIDTVISQTYGSSAKLIPSQIVVHVWGAFTTMMTTRLTTGFLNAVFNELIHGSSFAPAHVGVLLSYKIEPFKGYGQYAIDSAFSHADSPLPLKLDYFGELEAENSC
ncbi:hypothetical protein F5Y16DRAFT_422987 [Xylariaceae sp. FL0255]|nr:hypothetical protein F5Y16DRAFT_422987 [Xylariaceae sp. FL0255]